MRKYLMLLVLSIPFMKPVYGIGNGFYLGLALGPASNSSDVLQAQTQYGYENNIIQFTPADPKSSQFGSRFFLGNQFSPYAAFEFGFNFFSKIAYDTHEIPALGGTPSVRIRTIDIAMKGIFPFYFLSVYGKIGAAYSYITTSGALNPQYILDPVPGQPNVMGTNTYQQKIAPAYGFGATYDINQSWVAELSYSALQVGNKINSVTMIALGFSYHFTDKYCGQFLCDD